LVCVIVAVVPVSHTKVKITQECIYAADPINNSIFRARATKKTMFSLCITFARGRRMTNFRMNENGVERKCGAWFSGGLLIEETRALAWITNAGYGLTIAVMNA
jgi:hypothetical protein